MATGTAALTERQRQAVTAYEAARAAGVTLTAHCRAHGLPVRAIYDAVIGLRKRGVIAPAAKRPPVAEAFVAVELMRPAGAIVCRLVRADGGTIECATWPEVSWVRAVLAGSADAAA
ncbi:MAG: hypothetical protein O9284_16405 [Steroidobacteraceae bacterium]|jgi:hypothetical protein|nr:hypothetical protein [Steroidobacteraceae bacterium]